MIGNRVDFFDLLLRWSEATPEGAELQSLADSLSNAFKRLEKRAQQPNLSRYKRDGHSSESSGPQKSKSDAMLECSAVFEAFLQRAPEELRAQVKELKASLDQTKTAADNAKLEAGHASILSAIEKQTAHRDELDQLARLGFPGAEEASELISTEEVEEAPVEDRKAAMACLQIAGTSRSDRAQQTPPGEKCLRTAQCQGLRLRSRVR